MSVPENPFEGSDFSGFAALQRLPQNQLCLVQAVDDHGYSIDVAMSFGTNRGFYSGFGKTLRRLNGDILTDSATVINTDLCTPWLTG